MPSSPKVQKELILKTAMDLLIREGYAAINIKAVANELGCSTQPISRQFGSMDGFRKELLTYCIGHMKQYFGVSGNCVSEIVLGISKGYVTLAFDFPNIYKYFYMNEHEEEKMNTLFQTLRSDGYERIIEMLQEEYHMPESCAKEFLNHLNYYVHGIASYVAIGFVGISRQEVMEKVQRVSESFLKNWQEMTGCEGKQYEKDR